MEIRCEYCGSMIDDHAAVCPKCGAPNHNINRTVSNTPKTIEELQQWYEARHLPPQEVTRFFIGQNYQQPKAFGIYRDGSNVVVYKNKDDGSRAIRYRGTDEAYAVNELYLKLKSEILNQKALQSGKRSGGPISKAKNSRGCCGTGFLIMLALMVVAVVFCNARWVQILILGAGIGLPVLFLILILTVYKNSIHKKRIGSRFKTIYAAVMIGLLILAFVVFVFLDHTTKYYRYNGTVYCNYDDRYYYYDDYYDDYYPIFYTDLPDEFSDNMSDYQFSTNNSDWDSSYSFTDSYYYETHIKDNNSSHDSNWDSDSDYDWDSGSDWDSGGTDWSSDW